MTTPVGRAHLSQRIATSSVLGTPASIIGSELPLLPPLYGAPTLRFTPTLQGLSYVQITMMYIRKMIPAGVRRPRRLSWPYRGVAMPNFREFLHCPTPFP